MRTRRSIAWLLATALLAVPTVVLASRGFSRAEMGRLSRGRVVTRPFPANRRGLVGGNAWVVVRAPHTTVWRVLTDPGRYVRMWHGVQNVRVLSRRGNERLLRVRQSAPISDVTFTVRVRFVPARKEIDFRVAHGGGRVRSGWGFFRLEPQGDSRTLIAYGAVVDPGNLIRTLFQERFRARLLALPSGLKTYVERNVRTTLASAP